MSLVIKYTLAKGHRKTIIYLANFFKEVVICKR